MLFKFKSKACSDLIMLEADARRLLQIMLGNDPVKGIVLNQDLPLAIVALESAVAQDELLRKQRIEKIQALAAEQEGQTGPLSTVSLSQRATPMLRFLKRSLAEESDVLWGV